MKWNEQTDRKGLLFLLLQWFRKEGEIGMWNWNTLDSENFVDTGWTMDNGHWIHDNEIFVNTGQVCLGKKISVERVRIERVRFPNVRIFFMQVLSKKGSTFMESTSILRILQSPLLTTP